MLSGQEKIERNNNNSDNRDEKDRRGKRFLYTQTSAVIYNITAPQHTSCKMYYTVSQLSLMLDGGFGIEVGCGECISSIQSLRLEVTLKGFRIRTTTTAE